ncbi:MAG: glycoside hydrolase family 57 [SAR324 cluster bacterium]|nr:glycoside hydrolase family 57 [SAR324 cluster bacterium]
MDQQAGKKQQSHLCSISGTLLETLANRQFQDLVYNTIKCGDLLWFLQNEKIIQILGNAYYHPVLPLIPSKDREEHLMRWIGLAKHIFFRNYFPGFWPPEMGFCMEMIPLLKHFGYQYVMVDCEHVEPLHPMKWEELRYRPHIARYGQDEIIVVVRDRDLSKAQESGMNYEWFAHELKERTQWCDFPSLLVTCTDGENGEWFRNSSNSANFWNSFYLEFLNNVRQGTAPAKPIFIHEYINQHGCWGEVRVHSGSWNTGEHSGIGFIQWTGSEAQKDALRRIHDTSATLYYLKEVLGDKLQDPHRQYQMEEAMWHLLKAETSCYLYWGESWVYRVHKDLDTVWFNLDELRKN